MNLGRNTLYNLAGSILPLIVALATVPLYIKLIGIERYGALAVAWLILGYFGFFDMGLGRATAQRIAALKDASREQSSQTIWTAMVISVTLGVVGGAVLYLATDYYFISNFKASPAVSTEILAAIPALAITVPIVTAASVASGALQGREYFVDYNIATSAGSILLLVLPLAAAWGFGPHLAGLIVATGIARLIALLYLQQRVWSRLLSGVQPRLSRDAAKSLVTFGGWMTLSGIISPLLFMVDRVLISATLGAAAVGVYSIPFQISSRLTILPTALSNAVLPRMSYSDDAESERIWDISIRMTLAIMTPVIVGLIFNMHWLLQLWVGADIASKAYLPGQMLMISAWGLAMAMVPLTVLHGRAQPQKSLLSYLIEIPLYFLVLWLGLQYFGLAGVAAAAAFRSVLNAILLSAFASGFPAKTTWIFCLAACILSIAGAQLYENNFLLWLPLMICGVMLSAFVSWLIMPSQLRTKILDMAPTALTRLVRAKINPTND